MLFDHYYDLQSDSAKPIHNLTDYFASHGTDNVHAYSQDDHSFTAHQWQTFSKKEKDDILMSYRLAYRKTSFVNWCEELGTVLANDEVKDGVSERGGFPVVKRPMLQWALRITAYAERLLIGLDSIDFTDALKTQQRNWIGRSQGAKVIFNLEHSSDSIEVFTTRPDTLYGVTFMVLAPEHPLVNQIVTPEQSEDVNQYIQKAAAKSEKDRLADVKSVSGQFTGAYAIHPFTKEKLPIWISDYVLYGYGTGAIMAVPAHDERDHRFATHFNINIRPVIDQSSHENASISDKVGTMIDSEFMNGLTVLEAIEAAIDYVEKNNLGERQVNYKLRDANFSRQRYWGEPFPIKYDDQGCAHLETDLPLELPALDNYKPTSDGLAPLARNQQWIQQGDFRREIDTMPGYAGSSWYFLRYMDAGNPEEAFSKKAVSYWKDVDVYVGGAEHAVGHLMYSRFWHKFLFDLSYVPTDEPYKKLVNQGMLQGIISFIYLIKEKRNGVATFISAELAEDYASDALAKIPVYIGYVTDYGSEQAHLSADNIEQFKSWRPDYKDAQFKLNDSGHLKTVNEVGKMSKRYFNVVNPDDVIEQYGTDCFRMYEMFLGPLEDSKPWDTKGITGVYKFLKKLWSLFYDEQGWIVDDSEPTKDQLKTLHHCIKKVRNDIEKFSMNTCVSAFMVAVNDLKKSSCQSRSLLTELIKLMAPFAPYVTEQLWHDLGHEGSIHSTSTYPLHNESYLVENQISYPICINGKKRTIATFTTEQSKEEIEQIALSLEEIQKWIDGKAIRKVIVVPKRMVNIVV